MEEELRTSIQNDIRKILNIEKSIQALEERKTQLLQEIEEKKDLTNEVR